MAGEGICQCGNVAEFYQGLLPLCRYGIDAIKGSGQLTADGAGGVGVIAEIHCRQYGVFKAVMMHKTPESSLQRLCNIPAAADLIL